MQNNTLLTGKNKITAMIIVVLTAATFLVLGIFLGRRSDHGSSSANKVHAHAAAINHNHEHGDDEDESANLENRMCEHEVRIIDCDNCRFEVGMVKIDPSVAASLIKTGLVEDISRTKTLKLTGQVQLDRTRAVDVVPTGTGRVEQVKRSLGDKVEKGDILAVIHSADLGQVKADYLEAQAKLDMTGATFRREKELYEKKITSEADYLNAMNELKTAEALCAAADKRLRLFGLETEQIAGIKGENANGEFANLILRAPQGGTIIIENISVGKMLETTESLYTIADLTNLWVWCDVYEKDLAILHEQSAKGEPLEAVVKVRAFESLAFNGVVDLVGNLMDEHTRTVKMRVQVKNPGNKLMPGMFADVEVAIPLPERIAAVPQAAVMSDAGKNFVFQQWKDDIWVRRDVAVGSRYGDFVEISGGIPKGAKIVTGGAFMLKSDILREKMGAGCAD